MAGYVITWNAVSSEVIPGIVMQRVRRNLIGGVRDTVVSIPGRDGGYLFGERRGDRSIRVDGLVKAALGDRHDAVVALADWYDQLGSARLVVDDQPDRYWQASVKADADPDEWRHTGKFTLEWRAEPYAYAVTTTEVCATATSGVEDSFVLPGNVDAEVVIELTPLNGAITAFEDGSGGFTLTVGADTLVALDTIPQGETVTISGINNTYVSGSNLDLELTGAYVVGTVFAGDVSGDFPLLSPGTNTWTLTWFGSATLVRVCFTYRRRFR